MRTPHPQAVVPAVSRARLITGAVNWCGLYTLYLKEVWRFLKVPAQTLVGPAATTLLFLADSHRLIASGYRLKP